MIHPTSVFKCKLSRLDNILQTALRWLWCVLLFIVPLRWCYPAISIEQANMPLTIPEWLIYTVWPQFLLPFIAAILTLFAIIINRNLIFGTLFFGKLLNAAFVIPVLTLSPLLFGLAGLFNTTEHLYATTWYWHFYTIAQISLGLWLTSRFDRKLLPWLFNTIATSAVLAALEGWYQHFGGLEANLQMQLENARESGIALSEQMIEKMRQTRSFGHFIDPNVYAAHLLLTCPLLLVVLKRIGEHCTPPRLSQIILVTAGVIISGGALIFSGSRGGMLGAMVGLAIFAWCYWGTKLKRSHIIAIIAGCLIIAVAGVFLLNHLSNRRFETASVRFEYYATSVKIFAQHPICGVGLGEFFPWHMRLKPWLADEARDPHSLFFAMLAQCGIPGALDAILRLGLPFLLALGWLRKNRHADKLQVAAVLAAWCAWNAHSLLQFNDMIIATAVIAGFIGLFAFEPADEPIAQPIGPFFPFVNRSHLMIIPEFFIVFSIFGLFAITQLPKELAKQRAESELRNNKFPNFVTIQRLLNDAIDKAPQEPYPHRLQYDFACATGDFATAQLATKQLTIIQPHRSANWLRLALLSRICNAPTKKIEQALAQAQLWYPSNPQLWLTKAMLSSEANLSTRQLQNALKLDTEIETIDEQQIVIAVEKAPFPISALNNAVLRLDDGRKVLFVGKNL